MSGFGAVANGAITGFVAGGVATGSLKGALTGAFTGAMFGAIGDAFSKANCQSCFKAGTDVLKTGARIGKVAAHAMAGGISSVLGGGKFGHGFASAGFTQAVAPGIDGIDKGSRFSAGRVIAAATVGGTASVISGGKFANGAVTGAFSRAFNDESHYQRNKPKLVNPTGKGIRNDDEGHGHWDAPRGSRKHKGLDLMSVDGQAIVSPFDGEAVAFTGSSTGYPIVDITPTDSSLGIDKIRMLYVDGASADWVSQSVSAGQTIGSSVNLQGLGYSSGVTPHVHVQVMSGGRWVDPSPYFGF
jgi:murein DD-endopeptidase MepM/ murein hydrolase activator NlpD